MCAVGVAVAIVSVARGALGGPARSAVIDAHHALAGYTRPLWDWPTWRREHTGWVGVRFAGAAAGCVAHGFSPLGGAAATGPAGKNVETASPAGSDAPRSGRTRRVVDGFLFDGEFSLLRLRLYELAARRGEDSAMAQLGAEGGDGPVTAVAVESGRSFTGRPKRRLLAEAVRAAVQCGVGPLAGWIDPARVSLAAAGESVPLLALDPAAPSRPEGPGGGTGGGGDDSAAPCNDPTALERLSGKDDRWGGVPLRHRAEEWAAAGMGAPPPPPLPPHAVGSAGEAAAGDAAAPWLRALRSVGLPALVVVRGDAAGQSSPFGAEGEHRRGLALAGAAVSSPGDLLMSGDVDEIPRRDVVALLRGCDVDGSAASHGVVAPPGWVGAAADAVAAAGAAAAASPLPSPAPLTSKRRPAVRGGSGGGASGGRAPPPFRPSVLQLDLSTYLYSLEHPRGRVRHSSVTVRGGPTDDGSWWGHSRKSDAVLIGAGWHLSWAFRRVAQVVSKAVSYSHSDRAHRPEHTDAAAAQGRMCRGDDPFGQVPEATTWAELLDSTVAAAARRDTAADAPSLLLRQPWAMPWLLPGNCLREDDPGKRQSPALAKRRAASATGP